MSRLHRERSCPREALINPQNLSRGLNPVDFAMLAAWLKPCPFKTALNRPLVNKLRLLLGRDVVKVERSHAFRWGDLIVPGVGHRSAVVELKAE